MPTAGMTQWSSHRTKIFFVRLLNYFVVCENTPLATRCATSEGKTQECKSLSPAQTIHAAG